MRQARLVLLSASPRRLALLKQIGIAPEHVLPQDIDETPKKNELPRTYAARIATQKARAGEAAHEGDDILLAADTVVALGRRILPKAESAAEVKRCLAMLSGRRHMVMTAVAVIAKGKLWTRLAETRVAFKPLTKSEIEAYAALREGEGKAGGYAIQGHAEAFVRSINGGYSNVVGLPLRETLALLQGAGFKVDT